MNSACRSGIVIGIVFELNLLIFVAIRSSVRVADSIDLRLVPLNEDRAFVANMLVRAAFEMGTTPRGSYRHSHTRRHSISLLLLSLVVLLAR